ncbi:hypothetical protein COOONC_25876 [Cooperia oncophora]
MEKTSSYSNAETSIQAKTTTGSSTAVQISMHRLSIFTKRVHNKCHIDAGSLTGCYSCFQGARAQISCTSTLSEETAEIHCDNQTQLVKCSPYGVISNATFHFSTSSININCSVFCPAGQSTVTLREHWTYVNEPILQRTSLQHLDTYRATSTGFSIKDIPTTISNWFTSLTDVFKYWKTILLVLIVLIVIFKLLRLFRKRSIEATFIKKKR